MHPNNSRFKAGLATVVAIFAIAALMPAGASAACKGGGLTPAEVDICTPLPKAKLLANGMLIPPKAAPPRVKQVIQAANRIRNKPYIYGGGHGKWWDKGYDCSGAVSFALHGGDFLDSPMPSGSFSNWELPGEGRWITIYTNAGHMYSVIAGYRWDTSGNTDGTTGPSWQPVSRDTSGFTARHPAGF